MSNNKLTLTDFLNQESTMSVTIGDKVYNLVVREISLSQAERLKKWADEGEVDLKDVVEELDSVISGDVSLRELYELPIMTPRAFGVLISKIVEVGSGEEDSPEPVEQEEPIIHKKKAVDEEAKKDNQSS